MKSNITQRPEPWRSASANANSTCQYLSLKIIFCDQLCEDKRLFIFNGNMVLFFSVTHKRTRATQWRSTDNECVLCASVCVSVSGWRFRPLGWNTNLKWKPASAKTQQLEIQDNIGKMQKTLKATLSPLEMTVLHSPVRTCDNIETISGSRDCEWGRHVCKMGRDEV